MQARKDADDPRERRPVVRGQIANPATQSRLNLFCNCRRPGDPPDAGTHLSGSSSAPKPADTARIHNALLY